MTRPAGEGRRYRVLQTLGRGGFGTVYRAEMLAPGGFSKIVALKVLNEAGADSDDVALRLRDEARILGLVQHRAILRVDSLVALAEGWGVVMEYVPGLDVQAILVRHPPIPPRAALCIVEEVASALHAAFSAVSPLDGKPLRLVHRDIKPPNIRVTPHGEVKVLDFGVARADFDHREAATRSMTYGSHAYMAPERLEGIDTHAGDVFALGLTAVELLIGEAVDSVPKIERRFAPWLDGHLARADARLREAGAPAPIRERVLAVVRGMTSLDETLRPDARAVERDLRRLIDEVPGPRLRDWAEQAIPDGAPGDAATPDSMSGGFFLERSGGVDLVPLDRAALRADGDARPTSASEPAPRRAALGLLPWVALVGFIGLAGGAAALVGWGLGGPGGRGSDDGATPEPLAPAAAAVDPGVPAPETPSEGAADAVGGGSEPAAGLGVEPSRLASEASNAEEAPSRSRLSAPAREGPAPPATAQPSEPAPVVARPPLVRVEGDARAVELWDGETRVTPASATPGRYTVRAAFGDGEPFPAGQVELVDGETRTVACSAAILRCAVR